MFYCNHCNNFYNREEYYYRGSIKIYSYLLERDIIILDINDNYTFEQIFIFDLNTKRFEPKLEYCKNCKLFNEFRRPLISEKTILFYKSRIYSECDDKLINKFFDDNILNKLIENKDILFLEEFLF